MSETAKCPVCGKDPSWTYYPDQESLKIACCKVSIGSHDLWNQYAAAMELAKAAYESNDKDTLRPYVSRVMDVFNAK